MNTEAIKEGLNECGRLYWKPFEKLDMVTLAKQSLGIDRKEDSDDNKSNG